MGGPAPLAARQGREKQRYTDDGARCVAGCIPVRHAADPNDLSTTQVLVITSRNLNANSNANAAPKGRFVFPKGGWEEDESVQVAAQRETVEEAGVRGTLQLPMLGTFEFKSGKVSKGRCLAHVFVLLVSEELADWPEAGQRERIWVSLEEAYAKARYDWMREALRVWMLRKGWSVRGLPLGSGVGATMASAITTVATPTRTSTYSSGDEPAVDTPSASTVCVAQN